MDREVDRAHGLGSTAIALLAHAPLVGDPEVDQIGDREAVDAGVERGSAANGEWWKLRAIT